jgi:Ca-activated chloride channel family protein
VWLSWFANLWALGLLAVLPALALLAMRAWRRRRQALALLGTMPALHRGAGRRLGDRLVRNTWQTAGLVFLVLGVAGPQWGQEAGAPGEIATGRDLVVVLDLSRSMLAELPSRQERALQALRDLAASLKARGGHRVALVVFAAHASLVFPLTNDYDHFREALDQQDAGNLQLALRARNGETSRSGTRIGEALRFAVAAHDRRFKGAGDILLISDGDDPVGDDEWAEGAAEARQRGIPVYTVGVGDPGRASPIPTAKGPLRHGGQVVLTQLEERPLQEIARRTGGIYFPAHTHVMPLGKRFREVIAARGTHAETEASEPTLPLYRQHYAWFFAVALTLFSLAMVSGRCRPLWPVPDTEKTRLAPDVP